MASVDHNMSNVLTKRPNPSNVEESNINKYDTDHKQKLKEFKSPSSKQLHKVPIETSPSST